MGFLDRVGLGVNRKALHVVRVYCENCHNLFEDKYYKDEYSDKDASKKSSIGEHLVQCPYCDYINHNQEAHIDDIIMQGRFRDYAEEKYYGTKYGILPPDPRFNKIEIKNPEKIKFRDLNEIKCKPRKVA